MDGSLEIESITVTKGINDQRRVEVIVLNEGVMAKLVFFGRAHFAFDASSSGAMQASVTVTPIYPPVGGKPRNRLPD